MGVSSLLNFCLLHLLFHVLTSTKNIFQWRGKQKNYFETLKENINTTLVLAFPYLQQLFEIETGASDYTMGVVLMQQMKLICYHSSIFTGIVINYPTYDK